jgi:plasmid replication initiation protein
VTDRHTVVVSNELLAQPMSFSLSERRLLAMILSGIKPSYNKLPSREILAIKTEADLKEAYWKQVVGDVISETDTFTITVANYSELFEISLSNAKVELELAANKLFNRVIEVDMEEYKGKFRWVSAAVFHKATGTVSVRFTRELLPYIQGLQHNFTKIRLSKLVKLQSVYSWRLYELYRVKVGFNPRELPYFELTSLYRLMEVPPSRQEYRKFKERILKPVLAELAEVNGVKYEIKEDKEGRKVVGFWMKLSGTL